MFVNQEKIVELTGRKTHGQQIKWLRAHGFKHEISAIGRPIVLIKHLEEKLSGMDFRSRKNQEPDFSSLGI